MPREKDIRTKNKAGKDLPGIQISHGLNAKYDARLAQPMHSYQG